MDQSNSFSDRVSIAQTTHVSPEPKRDWNIWFLTGHRFFVSVYLIAGIIILYAFQYLLWSEGKIPQNFIEIFWSLGTFLWVSQIVPVVLGLMGIMAFRHPCHLDSVPAMEHEVCFRIVSRGTNVSALTKTIQRCQIEMSRVPAFPYVIEVVIDVMSADLPHPNSKLRYMRVPDNYRTQNNSLYKARALQYALENSPLQNSTWLVHLDEESHITSSGIKGICSMISEEECSGKLRIGQGPILYHRNWKQHPFLTLADNIRTGDDFARFYFQNKIGITLFGLHGSYIVVRNDIEKSIGFDFGPEGSITEDAFWALVAMERGYRCRWVDGYIEEQSTQSVMDFVKQRRRWFQGLIKVALHAPVKWLWRLSLGINVILWALAPFSLMYTTLHLFFGFLTNPWIHFLANLSFIFFIVLYLIGLKANLDEYRIRSFWRRLGWTFAQIILVPIFSFMEAAGVLMALLSPVSGFHVVKK